MPRRWSPLLPSRGLFGLALGLSALACVTPGKHGAVVEERDRLLAEVERLAASNASLSRERVELMESFEDLREQHATVSDEATRLARLREELATTLASREEALAAKTEELDRLRQSYDRLVADLEAEVASGRIEIEQLREGLRMRLPAGVLFAPGSTVLSAEGRAAIAALAARLRGLPYRIEVRGHTDDRPMRNPSPALASNWHLAGARAAGVVKALEQAGVDPSRLSAASFGAQRPLRSNQTPEGRAANRRIELRLLPAPGAPVPETEGVEAASGDPALEPVPEAGGVDPDPDPGAAATPGPPADP